MCGCDCVRVVQDNIVRVESQCLLVAVRFTEVGGLHREASITAAARLTRGADFNCHVSFTLF